MKYIKQYEVVRNQPKVGDYILAKLDPNDDEEIDHSFSKYIEKNIGQIIKRVISDIRREDGTKKFLYHIKYKDITNNDYDSTYCRSSDYPSNDVFLLWRSEITHWSKNKEELEYIIAANQYNL